MKYIEDFERALDKKRVKNLISYAFKFKTDSSEKIPKDLLSLNMSDSLIHFLVVFRGLAIDKPRFFKILDFDEIKVIENQFLLFAIIDETEKICFDMSSLNNANEWDIVSLRDKFIITSTISSFLTNKIWAWIDRGRTIWKEESYS